MSGVSCRRLNWQLMERARRAGEDGFTHAGDIFDEDVAAGDQTDEELGDGFASAEEDGFHVGAETGEGLHEGVFLQAVKLGEV